MADSQVCLAGSPVVLIGFCALLLLCGQVKEFFRFGKLLLEKVLMNAMILDCTAMSTHSAQISFMLGEHKIAVPLSLLANVRLGRQVKIAVVIGSA